MNSAEYVNEQLTKMKASGMALAFEWLFSRCVFEYSSYFTAI